MSKEHYLLVALLATTKTIEQFIWYTYSNNTTRRDVDVTHEAEPKLPDLCLHPDDTKNE